MKTLYGFIFCTVFAVLWSAPASAQGRGMDYSACSASDIAEFLQMRAALEERAFFDLPDNDDESDRRDEDEDDREIRRDRRQRDAEDEDVVTNADLEDIAEQRFHREDFLVTFNYGRFMQLTAKCQSAADNPPPEPVQ